MKLYFWALVDRERVQNGPFEGKPSFIFSFFMFFIFSLENMCCFFLLFSFFLVFLSFVFHCWHYFKYVLLLALVSEFNFLFFSVVGAPWRCGVLTT